MKYSANIKSPCFDKNFLSVFIISSLSFDKYIISVNIITTLWPRYKRIVAEYGRDYTYKINL